MMLMDEEFTAKLRSAKSVDEFMQIVDAADSERVSIDEQLQTKDGAASKILAVTSCPTGIAHTYMAAEGLERLRQRPAVGSRLRQEALVEPKMF